MKVSELQLQQGLRPVKPVGQSGQEQQKSLKAADVSFGNVLHRKLQIQTGLKFSAHAMKRLENRALTLDENDLQRLQQGVRQLEAKGAQNSVILMDNRAFVVSVKNRTVVTAMTQDPSNQNIFTNIDSLAIV